MFAQRFMELSREKKSHLCVGLDPVFDSPEEILDFCLGMIEEVCEYAVAVKPNTQFLFPLSGEGIRSITSKAKECSMLVILDHKLSDIGSSNASAIKWISRLGFDAFTFSPYAGNFSTIDEALKNELDVFTLALMSNTEAAFFQKARIEGEEAFKVVCRKVIEHDGCGCVIGATCARKDIMEARRILGERLILIPGIGAQGGSLDNLSLFRENSIVNVGRDIMNASDPKDKAKSYCKTIESLLKQ